jgi:hypothetical protein
MFGTSEAHPDYLTRLRTSMRRAIGDAEIREQNKATKGRRSAAVTITLDQVMTKLRPTTTAVR